MVLGGGGVVGVSWETGVLKGLREAGADPAAADLVIGTSAGAIVGSQLAAGRALDELLAIQLGPSDGRTERLAAQIDPQAAATLFAVLGSVGEVTREKRIEIGKLALSAKTPSEDDRLEMVSARLGGAKWPEKRLLITAVDALTGELVTWDRSSGVSLAQAVASSTSVPGMFPPVTIKGRRYIDGGIASVTSADLATGHDAVCIVAPVGRTGTGMSGLAGRQITAEVAALEQGGAKVLVVEPDEGALQAFGPNLMDPNRRARAAEAGLRQGKDNADRLRGLWSVAVS
jgi:NTE family protein